VTSGFGGISRGEGMERVRSALFAPDGQGAQEGQDGPDGARINSLELFLGTVATRIVNSRGVDVSWTDWRGRGEFIVNAGTGSAEVELFGEFEFSEPETERLSETVRRQLVAARDRLVAVPTPDCAGLPLLLSGELAGQVFGYCFDNLQGVAVYEKFSNLSLGDLVGREGGKGDAIELRAVPLVKGSPNGAPYDGSGFLLRPARCIEGGRVTRLVTSVKYAHYLGLPATGALPLFELAPGKQTEAELRSRPHIEGVTFSDFFVDSTTGDFGGEIRLAYVHRDGKRVPVTGGSITGSMAANRGELLLSSELEAKSRSLAPTACLLPVVTVSPATRGSDRTS
jgi:PmbA protein